MASDTVYDELAADLAVLGLSIIETAPNTDPTLAVMPYVSGLVEASGSEQIRRLM